MKAEVKTPGGGVAVIDGTIDEIREFLQFQVPPGAVVPPGTPAQPGVDLVAFRQARRVPHLRGRKAGQSNYTEEFKQEIRDGAARAGEGRVMAYLKSKGVSYSTWQSWEAKDKSKVPALVGLPGGRRKLNKRK